MSKAEDYLDGLLNSMEGKASPEIIETEPESGMEPESVMEPEFDMGTETDVEPELDMGPETDLEPDVEPETGNGIMESEDAFLDSFEKELFSGEDTDDFIRQFEQELAIEEEEEPSDEALASEEVFFQDLDGIVNGAKEKMQEQDEFSEPEEDIMVDTIGVETEDDDQDLMTLLQSEGDFSDIGDMLKADEENVALSDDGGDDFADFSLDGIEEAAIPEGAVLEEENPGGKRRKKKEKKQKSENGEGQSFLQRMSKVLFGEEEEEEAAVQPVKVAAVSAPSIEELSDENFQILQELEGMQVTEEPQAEPEVEEDVKEKKKREKEEKKAKAKQEKKEKQEQAKKARAEKRAKKEKKKKPPKEPDHTPPLPKKPVILVFVMVGSFLALVLIGTNLFGYSGSMSKAKKEYGLGNYEAALREVSGMELKEQDYETYEKYSIMGNAAGEYRAYQSFMEAELYDMALDSLIRTIGRCDKYKPDAEVYGCEGELERLRNQAVGALGIFGLSEERVAELYAMDDRSEYSEELYAVLEAAGLLVD